MVRIAIVGSGPAGLTAANFLVDKGFSVTVFDELTEFGGMMAYGIPEYRIPLSSVRSRVEEIKRKGVVFIRKRITSVRDLLQNYDYVILAIGAGRGAKSGIQGEEKENIIDALDFLLNEKLGIKKMIFPNDKVAVIGGGNSAIDAARVAKRIGADVTIIYRRTEEEMPAFKHEIEEAKREGVKFEFLKCPLEYKGLEKVSSIICSEMKLLNEEEKGRKKVIATDKKIELFFDKVILAIGQKLDVEWLEKEGIKTNNGRILVDQNYKTSLDRVYAIGDCVTGPKTIAEATRTAIEAVKVILEKCGKNGIF
ncbi:MAG: FAD-dependent oxidoreductase [Candidatus Diapherotrites archaeon]|nr:FAD-dependent oxidoreductase [Candidatus Diapherotrites archaeon]